MNKLFGTDGIRGCTNTELTSEIAFKIGQAMGSILLREDNGEHIIIGKDTRRSCDMLETALCSGIMSVGVDVCTLGCVPTPAIPYLVKELKVGAGIMISASHNPYTDNGIKIFGADGFKIPDEKEKIVEDIVAQKKVVRLAHPKDIGRHVYNGQALKKYIDYTISTISDKESIKNLKVLFDCAYGSACMTAREIFSNFEIEAVYVNNLPDGININKNAGSTKISLLKKQVIEEGFDLAIAFDGDADRVLFLDEKGNEVDGDQILALFCLDQVIAGDLDIKTVVGTMMTNLGIKKYIENMGIIVKTTQVGDRYVLEEMVKHNHALGGEQSGHIVLYNFQTTGDGQLTCLHLLRKICEKKKTLSELVDNIEKYPQILINIEVDNKNKYKIMEDKIVLETVLKWEKALENKGRILVRTSGTEPIVRVMVEALDESIFKIITDDFKAVFEERLAKL